MSLLRFYAITSRTKGGKWQTDTLHFGDANNQALTSIDETKKSIVKEYLNQKKAPTTEQQNPTINGEGTVPGAHITSSDSSITTQASSNRSRDARLRDTTAAINAALTGFMADFGS